MNPETLELLLLQGESSHLDYKRSQYRLRGATTEEKGEIVKDIIALANAWREVEGVILLGVAEEDGRPPFVVGIEASIDDADLQQLLNDKTNRPVIFRYSEHELQGHRVGVIQVPVQDRPVFLRKQLGSLRSGAVYLRRGTSTVEADPDEIAKMGRAAEMRANRPSLVLEFASLTRRERLGDSLECWGTVLTPPLSDRQLPVISEPGGYLGMGLDPFNRQNTEYWREMRDYVFYKEATTALGLAVTNESSVAAMGVRVEFRVGVSDGLILTTEIDGKPEWTHGPHSGIDRLNLRPLNRTEYRGIEIERVGDSWHVEVTFGKVQPGATVFTEDEFYVGSGSPMDIVFAGKLFADNLDPQAVELNLKSAPTPRPMTLLDIQTIEVEGE